MGDQEPPCDVAGGPLWRSLDSQDNRKTLTIFHCYQLLCIFEDLQPLLVAQQGQKPLIYLDALEALLSIKKAKLVHAIEQIWHPLFLLCSKWWINLL